MAQEVNPFERLQEQIDDTAAHLDVHDSVIERLKNPEWVLEANLAVEMDDGGVELFRAYRSRFNGDRGPHRGGIHCHPNVSRDGVKVLSGRVVYRCVVVGIPYGGDRDGIVTDPKAYSESEFERTTRSLAKKLHPPAGENRDTPMLDVNTGQREMDWVKDTYETLEDATAPGVITGKVLSNGRSEGRVEATGRSVIFIAHEAFNYLGRDVEGATVVVQGYGDADSIAARLVGDLGASVVAVPDSSDGIYDPDDLDTRVVKDFKSETGTVLDYEGTGAITNEELLTLDVDLLVPVALENAIDGEPTHDVKVDTIVEAANGSPTPDTDDVLTEREIHVLPDILINAGGVTVSHFEWAQNRQRLYWAKQRVNDELERVIVDAFEELVDVCESHDLLNLRTAAYVVVIRRVVDSYDSAGNWP